MLDSKRTADELLTYLNNHGSDRYTLEDYCGENGMQFWPFPICDGEYLGHFLVPVKEGILCLPYSSIKPETRETFVTEHSKILTLKDALNLQHEWINFSDDIGNAIIAMVKRLETTETE